MLRYLIGKRQRRGNGWLVASSWLMAAAAICGPDIGPRTAYGQESVSKDRPEKADATSSDFKPLFDGKSLKGWDGDMEWFRVENDAIVAGKLDRKIPNNFFLSTQKEYGDFELVVEAKLVGPGNNAGVQFRTKRIPDHHEVIGYQADIGLMGERSIWGALYDESRRRKFLAQDPDVSDAALKPDDWNEIRIVAKGPRIQIFLNGKKTVDFKESDPKIERKGIIAVQVHSGKALEAWYRNLRIREL